MHRRGRVVAGIFVCVMAALLASPALSAESPLKVAVTSSILPVAHGAVQEIVIELAGPGVQAEQVYEVELATDSGYGVLLLPGGPAQSGWARCRVGEPTKIAYRWSGPVPTEFPIEERVSVAVPLLDAAEQVAFSVGVDLYIKEIELPQNPQNGVFSPVALIMEDAFHPEADIENVLSTFLITPEVRMALVPETITKEPLFPTDPVANKFFGRGGAERRFELSYPGADFKAGLVGRDRDGRLIWHSVDGRQPGITPPTAGKFYITATLKSNTGGVALKEARTRYFDVAGEAYIGEGLPYLIGATLEILAGIDNDKAHRVADDIRTDYAAGGEFSAASSLGIYMNNVATPTPVQMLGRYVHALTAANRTVEEMAPFIQNFLRGYGEWGVLIFSRSGVQSWRAVGSDKNRYTQAPQGRVYEDDRYVVIPFKLGVDFVLTLEGSNKGATTMWKIIPAGINRKQYPQGDWEKEITVHTGILTPPPQNQKMR